MTPGGGMVGGPRHYEGPTLGQISVWKCPSCGVENSSVFEEGCPSCGAGSAKPRHVGIPPSRPTTPLYKTIDLPAPDSAFGEWLAPHRGEFSPRIEALLLEAWTSAIRWYQMQLQQGLQGETTEPLDVDRISVPRPLLKRLLDTIEFTADMPDDQQSPELVTLIAELKELLES